jgi:hypothetical protein
LNHGPSPFCFISWRVANLDHNPPVYTSCEGRMIGVCHHIQLFSWLRWGSLTFSLLALNHNPDFYLLSNWDYRCETSFLLLH